MESTEPVTFAIVSPREPRKQEGQRTERDPIQNTAVAVGTAVGLRVAVKIPVQVIKDIPDR